MEEIINRVAQSSLITINLEDYYDQNERIEFDIKDWLFNGIALKEKDFRNYVREHDWAAYEGKNVAIHCSVDAIIPTWAYMLIITELESIANAVIFGKLRDMEQYLFNKAIAKIDLSELKDAKVIVKGCGRFPVPTFAYAELTRLLTPLVSSLMYGEACSAVPVYKKPKSK